MTITIELPPDAGLLLEEKARRDGEEPGAVAAALLVEQLAWEARDYMEAIAGIQRGLGDFEAGRARSFEDAAEEQRQKHGLPATS